METTTEPQPKMTQPVGAQGSASTQLTKGVRPRTAAWRRTFLRRLAEHGSPTKAAREAGISQQYLYRVRDRKPRFARAWQRALEVAEKAIVANAEDALRKRGIDGWEEPVYQGKELVGTRTKFSDACLIRVLEAEAPAKYARRSEGGSGGSTTVNVAVQLGMLSDPVAVRLACELDARLAQGAEPQGLPAPDGG